MQPRGNRRPHEVEHRRQHVHELHRCGDAPPGPVEPRLLDDERNAKRVLVERDQRTRVAVVGGQENRRTVVQAALLQDLDEACDGRFCGGRLDLDEQKEPLAALRAQPSLGRVDGQDAVAFERQRLRILGFRKIGVEEREPLRHSRLPPQLE